MVVASVGLAGLTLGCYTFAQTLRYDSVLPGADYGLPAKRIVLTPVTVPDDLEILEDRVARIDSLLYAALLGAGYDVVPASEYAAIWDSLTAAAGGFFDPYTGERNEVQYDSAVTVLFATLKERFAPQVLMYPELWVTEAQVFAGYAYWDGYRDPFDLRYREGPVLALSLILTAEDLTPREILNHGTGVQVIERMGADHVSLEMIDTELILVDSGATALAVERLVEPLVEIAERARSAAPAPSDTARQLSASGPSHPRRRNHHSRATPVTSITVHTAGYPQRHRSSGMFREDASGSKFMP